LQRRLAGWRVRKLEAPDLTAGIELEQERVVVVPGDAYSRRLPYETRHAERAAEIAFRPVPLAFLFLWQLHYLHRTFVYPLRMRIGASRTPLTTLALAIAFNVTNASLNAYAISHGALRHVESWFTDPRFGIGVALFLVGWAVNLQSDTILRNLRKPGESGYAIPHGGLFRFVSCPNYLGEIIEWSGWALATWTWAGAAFAFFTIANLLPRALSHHRWYREKFPDYPRERKAIIPGLL